jgi:hypothetical protein
VFQISLFQAASPQVEHKASPGEQESPMPPRLFFSYSHKDRKLREKLETHLSPLKNQSIISCWFDGCINPGEEWDSLIRSRLNSAEIILLLVSADFLVSDYGVRTELARAMVRHERGEAAVIPIILRPVIWQTAPFAKLKVLPADGKPVTKWNKLDEAFADIAEAIRLVALSLKSRRDQPQVHEEKLDLSRPVKIEGIRKHEKIDAKVIANVAFPSGQLSLTVWITDYFYCH